MTQQGNYQRVVIFLAVCIVLGAAFVVLKPDRDACAQQ
jgi:heme/copper-type cytochrome/quinol oxidase subunit 3